jgi:glycosyltransferase involved in cell wall biosynthesis
MRNGIVAKEDDSLRELSGMQVIPNGDERCTGLPDRSAPEHPIRVLELRAAEGAGGGPEKTILLGAARTDPERFAVTVCYIRTAGDGSNDIEDRARQLGVDYVGIPQNRLVDPGVWRLTRRLVRERQFHIVHAHDYKTDLLALLLARVEPIVPLATAHGWTGHSWREKLVYYPIDKRLLRSFPRVVAVSSEIREELVRGGARPERVTTILNGIDHRVFRRNPLQVAAARAKFGIGPGDLVLGSMGRVEPQKRFDILLEVFARLARERRRLRLLIAGEGGSRPELEALAERLGISPICRFLGHVGNVSEFHHAIDLFVQSSEYEGTPNVVLEAMALETPVVATAAGGTAEILADGVHGWLVPTNNKASLEAAIARALDDPQASLHRVRAARRRVEGELSFEARMRRLEGIYQELMDSAARSAPGRRAQGGIGQIPLATTHDKVG